MAHVHVVIIGLDDRDGVPATRRLFSYADPKKDPHESAHTVLSPYLFDAEGLADPHLVVRETSSPINGLPEMDIGSQPIDDGNYIFNQEQRADLLAAEPGAVEFLRPYIGARELIQGQRRWVLALMDAEPSELKEMPSILARVRKVGEFRAKSRRKSTLAIADTPTR